MRSTDTSTDEPKLGRHHGGHQLELRGGEVQLVEDVADGLADEGALLLGEADVALFKAGL